MANAPVQVLLNVDSFRQNREIKRPASSGTDFFEGRDGDFEFHKSKLRDQLSVVRNKLANGDTGAGADGVGYVKVTLQQSALAKSHRPTKVLFTEDRAPVRGSTTLGELISEVNVSCLDRLGEAVEKAENTVRKKPKKNSNELIPSPSRYRCEVGAIEQVELWDKADRRQFDLQDAIRWLSDGRTGHCYNVELFEMPVSAAHRDTVPRDKRKLFDTFSEGLRSFGNGIIARIPDGMPNNSSIVEITLTQSSEPPAVLVHVRASVPKKFDSSENRHRDLIGFLESHALVRHIGLPNILIRSATQQSSAEKPLLQLPVRNAAENYPVVGVIDGGVSTIFSPWFVMQLGFLAPSHQRLNHGSFISGLLVEGSAQNPSLQIGSDGCLIADINLFPDENQIGVFEQYYPNGISDFLDEVASAVETCRKQYGVRIFNLSLNVVSGVLLDRYSLEAQRLDKIAEENDVVFVISAGNLEPNKQRLEWPEDVVEAASVLAAHRDDQLFVPAESIRNISVAAINPEGLTNCVPKAPARYSRRGPGLKTGVKPDLCHIGGSGTKCPKHAHGLFSRSPNGSLVSECGTSYAAPLVARTLAAIASKIEGEVSRETLIALALHHARIPDPLQHKAFGPLARQLAGFGCPSSPDLALSGEDHEITILFSSRVFAGKIMQFPFAWPTSLVMPGGKCKGDVRLTLVATPTIDYRFGEELVRVNLEAALQQENKVGKFESVLEPTYVFFSDDDKAREAHLIEHKFKWSPVKSFARRMPKGRGASSNWRLVVNYLTRDGETIPKDGIPFSILLTIADSDKEKPIFQEMRQSLQASGIQTADIRTAARVTPRV